MNVLPIFWAVLGIGLWIFELTAPALIAGAVGTAALLMLLIGQWIPNPFLQLFVFAALASVFLLLTRRLMPKARPELENPFYQEQGTVTVAIEPGRMGRVALGGTTWNACCQVSERVLPAGSKVLVVAQKGTVLTVVPLEML